ncbi:hypothetical protein F2Q69_00029997 [Brassica cretica]|uniref:Uncharacterized protein n=1 Tax=Brassica cretica TaxID=69181 RepID=A0A8S9SAN4_BRACR|nr:hypothetical protein F2Q69_00029997 [Brassica cretica]
MLDEEETLLHHSSWKRNGPSIDTASSPSIDNQPQQQCRKRASTDTAYNKSVDTEANYVREGDYSIGSWADDYHHESYAMETELQAHAETNSLYPEACGRGTWFSRISQRTGPAHQKRMTDEFYDTAGGIDKRYKPKFGHPNRPSIDIDFPKSVDRQPKFGRRAFDFHGTPRFFWEEKNQYGVYRDDQGYARDLDGNTIRIHNMDIRRVLDRASRDEPSYICLPEHANLFTQTKLVPEIYTKDEVNEMFYGVCGEHEKNKEAFQMKLDGVYYPLNDSISWLTTCMEEMKQDIARIQNAADTARPPSIDREQPQSIDNRLSASIDNNLPHPSTMKSQPDFHTREEIDQLVEGIYKTLETTEERLDRRCDDIYFPMDLTISALTSKVEAIQGELVEI